MKKSTGCTCDRCIEACKHIPGWFAPGEAQKAAKFLKIPWEKFKKKLIVEYWEGDRIYVLAPRKAGVDEKLSIASFGAIHAKGNCVFLKKNRCSIHKVKPTECKKASCTGSNKGLHWKIAKTWKKNPNQALEEMGVENEI